MPQPFNRGGFTLKNMCIITQFAISITVELSHVPFRLFYSSLQRQLRGAIQFAIASVPSGTDWLLLLHKSPTFPLQLAHLSNRFPQ